jgi:hypothetical protein
MLRDRYAPMDLFALVPPLSMALDPILTGVFPFCRSRYGMRGEPELKAQRS